MSQQNPKYKYKASETFWARFYSLAPDVKERIRDKWDIFKIDPFAPALRTHRINRLSSRYGRTVFSVVIDDDLRVVFCIEENTVFTIDIGTHDIYK